MILPDFIIIGAMKAGTTTLYRYLDDHPEVGMSRLKETDFFIESKNYGKGLDWYSGQFEPGKRLYGEASPNYTKSRDFKGVPELMARHCPNAKLLYLVRDPVDRFVSQYNHAWLVNHFRETPEQMAGGHEWEHTLDASRYHRQLEAFLAHYPLDRIEIVDFDELTKAPATALGRIGAYLGVENLRPGLSERVENSRESVAATPSLFFHARRLGVTELVRPLVPAAAERKLKAMLANGRKRKPPRFPDALRARLAEELKDDTDAFRALVGRPFGHWRV